MRQALLLLAALASAASGLRVGPVRMGPSPSIAKPKTQIKQRTFGGTGDGGGPAPGAKAAIARPKMKRATEEVPLWKVRARHGSLPANSPRDLRTSQRASRR